MYNLINLFLQRVNQTPRQYMDDMTYGCLFNRHDTPLTKSMSR